MFEKWYALDAGACTLRLYNFSTGKEVSMRTCLAYKDKEILAVSKDALEYVYQQNASIKVRYPITQGRIVSDISYLLQKAMEETGGVNRFYRPCLLIVLPERNAKIENEWILQLRTTDIKKYEFISNAEVLTDAKPTFFIHAGHSYTQMGFVVNGKEIVSKTIYFAGQQMDEMIQKIVAKKTQCLISDEDAKELKEHASMYLSRKQNANLSCFGMNKYHKYQKIEISAKEIWPAMENVEKQIVLWAKECRTVLGLDMQMAIAESGIVLSGGLANCFGLKQYLEHELKCPVKCSMNPEYDIFKKMKEWK